jgi:hypothetical protein
MQDCLRTPLCVPVWLSHTTRVPVEYTVCLQRHNHQAGNRLIHQHDEVLSAPNRQHHLLFAMLSHSKHPCAAACCHAGVHFCCCSCCWGLQESATTSVLHAWGLAAAHDDLMMSVERDLAFDTGAPLQAGLDAAVGHRVVLHSTGA